MATSSANLGVRAAGSDAFYLRMALVVAFGGFFPTYWLQVARGTFGLPPIVHVHGLLFFAWTLFYVAQTALVATGRRYDHRRWGLAGIALFAVMMCSVVATQVAMMNLHESHGFGDAGRRFSAISLGAIPILAGVLAVAIANARRQEVHKRLMVLLMVMFMQPAVARVFIVLLAPGGDQGPPPPFVTILPGLVADLLLLIPIIRDVRVLGGPHPVYAYGTALVIAHQVLIVPLAGTGAWLRFAGGVQHLLG